MALNDVTISFDLSQLLGAEFDSRRTKAYVTTNVENATLMDTSTGETRLGDQAVAIATDGTGSFTTWGIGADGNPISWQTSLVIDYPRAGQRDRKRRTFGPYTIADADDGKNIADLEEEQAVPAEYLTAVTAELNEIRDEAEGFANEAEAARDATITISGLTGEDAAVGALVVGTGGAGPITRAALAALIEEQTLDVTDVGNDLDLWAGQSNAVGYGAAADINTARFDFSDPRVRVYSPVGTYAGTINLAVEPVDVVAPAGTVPARGIGPALTFAKSAMRQMHPNRRKVIVNTAVPGQGFAGSTPSVGTWRVTGGAGTNWFDQMISTALAAKAVAGINARFTSLCWVHGENDASASTSGATYLGYMDALVDAARTQLGVSDLPFVIGQMRPDNTGKGATWAAINSAQIEYPATKLRTAFAYGPTGIDTTVDPVHYTAKEARALGESMADALIRARLNVLGTPALPPRLITIVQSGTTLTATVTMPYSRVTDINFRYRIVGAGSWTNLTRAASIDRVGTITGTTNGQTYEIQARTANEQGNSAWSDSYTIVTATTPGQVTGLTAGAATATTQVISWTAVAGATSYLVEYKTHASGTWLTHATITAPAVDDTIGSLLSSTSYDYRVTASNAAGTGTASSTLTTSTPAFATMSSDVGVAPWAAWSVSRRLVAGYSGPLLRVRHTGTNVETDIGLAGDLVDEAALTTAAAGGTLTVAKVYDQSSNARDVAATSALQPRIVNAGTIDKINGHVCSVHTVQGWIRTGVGLVAAGAASQMGVVKITAAGATVGLITEAKTGSASPYYQPLGFGTTGTSLARGFNNDAGTVQFGNVLGTTTIADMLRQVATTDSGTSSLVRQDGATKATDAYTRSGTFALLDTLALMGSARNTGTYSTGNFCEAIAWSVALTSGQYAAGEANEKAFYGTP